MITTEYAYSKNHLITLAPNRFTIGAWGETSLEFDPYVLKTPGVQLTTAKTSVGFSTDGGLDLFITFLRKPASNRLVFPANLSGLDACPQLPVRNDPHIMADPLVKTATDTAAFDAGGKRLYYRPAHIAGSIIFFHKTKGIWHTSISESDKYGIGKAFTLFSYGPTARWSVEGDSLVLTVNQKVLDAGPYPLTLQPLGDIIGYDANPATEKYLDNGYSNRGCLVAPRTAVTGDTITAYKFYGHNDGTSRTIQATAYTMTTIPTARFAAGTNIVLASGSPAWVSSAAVSQALVNGTKYCVCAGAWPTAMYGYYDDAGSGNWVSLGDTGALAATWTDEGFQTYKYGIQAVYTAGGGTAPIVLTFFI